MLEPVEELLVEQGKDIVSAEFGNMRLAICFYPDWTKIIQTFLNLNWLEQANQMWLDNIN